MQMRDCRTEWIAARLQVPLPASMRPENAELEEPRYRVTKAPTRQGRHPSWTTREDSTVASLVEAPTPPTPDPL